ncbi:hypothetical protein JG687_00014728 [Phytophthora cactorum]|uniref:Uncharacterized protein n=1 Tax=Phytophthora cactorum TaxID=29920 RepID=A0A8T1TWW5_9STRA|nr:hypothetical protein JG687_00014728 [Phytophthora cactorum]
MKDCGAPRTCASGEGQPVPLSTSQLAQLLARSRVHDLSCIRDKLEEMADYTCKLSAVETEFQELLEQELDHAYQLSTNVCNPRTTDYSYMPTISVLLEECCYATPRYGGQPQVQHEPVPGPATPEHGGQTQAPQEPVRGTAPVEVIDLSEDDVIDLTAE